jgi:D-glycerate 3-kinase
MTEQVDIPDWQNALLRRHQLSAAYLDTARAWLSPLARAISEHQNRAGRPVLIALNGCQGSGKTTAADFLCSSLIEEHSLNAVALSLDDFYLTKSERLALAHSVHPLFATRGVPGTHDMDLMRDTLDQLLSTHYRAPVAIPVFDKAADDQLPSSRWNHITTPVQVVLLEGWCLGARPEPTDTLSSPINALERDEDSSGLWRGYSNEALRQSFQPLYQRVDHWIMLRAPSFECVFDWRREQEHKLADTLTPEQGHNLMNDRQLRRFIQHYERITRNCLNDLPDRVNHLFSLNTQRQVTDYAFRQGAELSPKVTD